MPKNKFKTHYRNLESPASSAFAITPNDSTDIPSITRALWIGGAGDVRVDMLDENLAGSNTVTFSGVAAGTMLPISVSRVHATGTTATLILGLY